MRKLILLAALLASVAHASPGLVYSSSAGGTYLPLSAATVSGPINIRFDWPCTTTGPYVFVQDGVAQNTEQTCPFALGGDTVLLDTRTLNNGVHIVTVSRVGTTMPTEAIAAFVVANATPTLTGTLTFTANPPVIKKGASSVLTWTGTNLSVCHGSWASGVNLPTSGTLTVSPVTRTQYVIGCDAAPNATQPDTPLIQVDVYVPAAWSCLPNAQYPLKAHLEPIPAAVSSVHTYSATWSCKTDTGVQTWVALGTPADAMRWALRYAAKQIDVKVAQDECAADCGILSASEKTYTDALLTQYRAKTIVAPLNLGVTTAPVFARVNGKIVTTTPLENARVTVGSECWAYLRGQPGLEYYSVQNLPNVATTDPVDVLPESFALCSTTAPLGLNSIVKAPGTPKPL